MMTRLLIGCVTVLWLATAALVVVSQMLGHALATHTLAFTSDRDGSSEIYLADTASGLLLNLTHDPARDDFPVWSPDGRLLIYQSILESATTSLEDDMEIHVIDFQTGQNRRLFNLSVGRFEPVWAADSRHFAFTIIFEVYVADVETGDYRNVSNSPAPDRNPTWSPDGQHVAFVSERDGNQEIYLADVESSDLRNLSSHPDDDLGPVWSPDGTELAFTSFRSGAGDIYIFDLATNELRNITRGPALDFRPIWHVPAMLIYASMEDDGYALRRVNLDGSSGQQLAEFSSVSESLAVSPDNSAIALHVLTSVGYTDIFMVPVDGSPPVMLTDHPDHDFTPLWSPDSRTIAFTSLRDQNDEIYLLDVQTMALRNLSHSPAADYNAAWRPA